MKRLVSLLSIALIVCTMIPVATLPVSAEDKEFVSSWAGLKQAIEEMGATTVILKGDVYKHPTDETISLKHSVHFDWSADNPPKIYNKSNERAFTIDAENVTMSFNSVAAVSDHIKVPKNKTEYRGGFIKVNSKNTTIKGLKCDKMIITSGSGAGIWVNNDLVTIEDCYFENAFASDKGGAIYIGAGCEGVKIKNSTFKDCEAWYGGAIYINGYKPEITGCTFTGCHATNDGGAIYANDDAEIKGCHFTDNTADDCGGSIISGNGPGRVLVKGCDFKGGSCGDVGIWVDCWNDAEIEECTPGDSSKYYKPAKIDSASSISTIFSNGNIWIIGGVIIVAIAAIVLIALKRRKKTA